MGILTIAGLITICFAFCSLSVPELADAYSNRLLQKPSIFHLFRISGSPSHPPADHVISPTFHTSGRKKHRGKPPSISITPAVSPSRGPAIEGIHAHAPSPSAYNHQASLTGSPSISSTNSRTPAPSPVVLPDHFYRPILPPSSSPLGSMKKNKDSPLSPVLMLPPPPPNQDCMSVICTEPLTYTPPGSACGCVWPIQVKIRLGVGIYTFFPLVSILAEEIAKSVSLNLSQVRVMGADAASQQLEKTTVIINLVPKGVVFNGDTAFSIYQKFWQGKVSINASLFGAYEVLYVHYPGLPLSPPSSSSTISTIDEGPNHGNYNGGNAIKPLGVDVPRRKKQGLGANMIAVIILSSVTAFVVCVGFVWILILKHRTSSHQPKQVQPALIPSLENQPGNVGSAPGSASMSISSGTLTYTGSAKNFSLQDIERATSNFSASRILGEGGFGLVYKGDLDDGREVAVKVLKRDNHQGTREFLAEVEMLSRLHHRNLVKLIGICTEDQSRCLIYELVPNGSVESRLHGVERETDLLDWDARMKIALGAARGLAYLHEDSNPRVIHRDFKSSNILLEHDFTPKVADFGLARTTLEENKHISTHVMGTFGYLAPEYAMTGHLLVKSDVYSYGVVLLELLTGRKPVDLSLPPGQENLVAWARPLLMSKEGLETIIDVDIKSDISFDSLAKVAAIASMCVQPEVSHRPFMGEVVQALKLVCNEFDEAKQLGGSRRSFSQEEFLASLSTKLSRLSGEIDANDQEPVQSKPFPASERGLNHEAIIKFSASDLLSASVGVERHESESFRWRPTSEPLRTGRRRHFWQRLRSLSRGSMSEHGFASKFWSGFH